MPGVAEKQVAEIRDRAVASAAAQGLPAKVQDAILRRALAFEQLFELSRRAFEMQAEG